MKQTIPLIDYIGAPLLVTLFFVLLWLQRRFPLRRQNFGMLRRLVRNLVLSIPSHAVFRVAMLPLPLAVAAWAQRHEAGLLHWVTLPGWAGTIASFLLMDYAYWWWHWLNHRIPFFWRFHNVHHTDLDMDVSTASRFHFGELIFSVGFLAVAVVVLGIAPVTLLVFLIAFEGATQFHHSNWRLPLGLERALNRVIVTPRMHGIHHSIVEQETNSNWGTIFCWWDKLHGTLRRDVSQDEITTGVAAYREEKELTIGKLLVMPFFRQRPWQLPDGARPEREPRQAKELAP